MQNLCLKTFILDAFMNKMKFHFFKQLNLAVTAVYMFIRYISVVSVYKLWQAPELLHSLMLFHNLHLQNLLFQE